MGVEPYLLSWSILGIVAQRLIRTICPACKTEDAKAMEKLNTSRYPIRPSEQTVFYKGSGCQQCNRTGYRGRTVVYEYLVPDEQIKQAAIKNQSALEIRRLAIQRGMRTLEQIALKKAEQGQTSVDEIIPLITADQEEAMPAD